MNTTLVVDTTNNQIISAHKSELEAERAARRFLAAVRKRNGATSYVHTDTPVITSDDVVAMRAEAAEAGDDAMVADCDKALSGVWAAAQRCARIIYRARV